MIDEKSKTKGYAVSYLGGAFWIEVPIEWTEEGKVNESK